MMSMTVETRNLISPSDILSIGFECKQCSASGFVPIEKIFRQFPVKCPNCGEQFLGDAPLSTIDQSDAALLDAFVKLFAKLRSRTFSLSMRFEIAQPKKEGQ